MSDSSTNSDRKDGTVTPRAIDDPVWEEFQKQSSNKTHIMGVLAITDRLWDKIQEYARERATAHGLSLTAAFHEQKDNPVPDWQENKQKARLVAADMERKFKGKFRGPCKKDDNMIMKALQGLITIT